MFSGICVGLLSAGFVVPAHSQQSPEQILLSSNLEDYEKSQAAGYVYTTCSVILSGSLNYNQMNSVYASRLPGSIHKLRDHPAINKYLEGFPGNCFSLVNDISFVDLIKSVSGSKKSENQFMQLNAFGIGALTAACAVRRATGDYEFPQDTSSMYSDIAIESLPSDQAAFTINMYSSFLKSDPICFL